MNQSTHDRWWTDVAKAQQVLGIVGGDDVAQGVGTVALGYHAVLADQLRPLAGATLVDQQQIAEVLDQVDLAPVAKAMSAAVSPVLGNAAPAYAADLVELMHNEAREGIRHELQVLLSKGVAWPHAVERVASVAGVPARAVNGFVQKMAVPQVNPRVLEDEADRTLMTWASRFGKREATSPLGEVAKDDFDEAEHPRGEDGRFVDAPDDDRAEADTRAARQARISRISRIAGVRSQQQAAAEQERRDAERKKSLAELQAEVLGRPAARQQAGRAQVGRAQAGRAQQSRAQAFRAQATRAEAPRAEQRAQVPATRHDMGQAYSHKLSEHAMLDITPGDISIQEVGDIISATEMNRVGEASTKPGQQSFGQTRLLIDGAYVTDHHDDGTVELDNNYDYRVVNAGLDGLNLVLRLQPISPVDKADTDFDEAEHPRGDDGRFVDAEQRRQRLSRLSRIAGLSNRQTQQAAAAAAQTRREQESQQAAGAALARMQQPRQQAGRAQSGRAQAGRQQTGRPQAQSRARAGEKVQAVADIDLAEKHAILMDETTFAMLTDHYIGDQDLEDGLWLTGLTGATPTEVKRLMGHTPVMRGDQVSNRLVNDAWQSIQQQPRQLRSIPIADDGNVFTTMAEAKEWAAQELMGQSLNENLEAYVPGVEVVGNNLFRPVAYRQPLRDHPESPDSPRHIIAGDSAAILRLRNGNTDGLVIRRVTDHVDGEDLERMGGGGQRLGSADVYIDSAVFEVIDTRQARSRRA